MPKKSTGRKKGIRQSIPRHFVGSKRTSGEQEGENNESKAHGFFRLSRSKYFSYSRKCFGILLLTCEKLHLIGFKRTSSREYVPLNRRGQILHYVAIAGCLTIFLQKFLGTLHLLVYEELRIQSFICVNLATVQVASVLLGIGVVMRPKETTDLLNSWSYVSSEPGQVDSDKKFHPLHDLTACWKVIAVFFLANGITLAAALLSLAMSDLRICLFPIAESHGLLPEGVLSPFAWQLVFAPFEWLTYLPFLAMASSTSSILFMGTGALNIFLEPLRMVRVSSVAARGRLERMYVELELFNRIFQVWIRSFFPTWLLGYSCGTIICIFITIRYTELPLIVYILFPYTALTLLMTLFWQSYDMICVSRGSEDILGGLMQQQAPYLLRKTRQERVDLMKRAKVMRPLAFPVGNCEFSLSVPMSTWEEILNQVVFLLSL